MTSASGSFSYYYILVHTAYNGPERSTIFNRLWEILRKKTKHRKEIQVFCISPLFHSVKTPFLCPLLFAYQVYFEICTTQCLWWKITLRSKTDNQLKSTSKKLSQHRVEAQWQIESFISILQNSWNFLK